MEELLTQLKLGRIREVYREWKASREDMSYADFLSGLLSEEICARQENQIRRKMQQASFPFEKTIEQFDFSLRPELKRQVILNCMDETFVHQGRSMVLIGPENTFVCGDKDDSVGIHREIPDGSTFDQ